MGFRIQKRIKLWKGLGINLGKKGVSTSYRTKRGSVSSKGYSIRTGIPGLTYRKSFPKSSKSGCMLTILLLITFSLSITMLIIN